MGFGVALDLAPAGDTVAAGVAVACGDADAAGLLLAAGEAEAAAD